MKALLLALPIVAATSGARVLVAQTDGVPQVAPELITLLGNLGIVGVLVWHLWYHTTHSYPMMQRQYAEQAEKLEKAFTGHVERLEKTFVREQDASREHGRKTVESLRADNTELRNMLIETMRSMRTAVHDVKDTAQAVMTKDKALAEQLRREVRARPSQEGEGGRQ